MSEKPSREELLSRIEKEADNYERDSHGCSRCVLKPLQDHLNLGDDESFKASTPLAAGVAMRGETCGALLGGIDGRGNGYCERGYERYGCVEEFSGCWVQISEKGRKGVWNHKLYKDTD